MSKSKTLMAAGCALSIGCLAAPQIASAADQQADQVEGVQVSDADELKPELRSDGAAPGQSGYTPASEPNPSANRPARPNQSRPNNQLVDDANGLDDGEMDDGAGMAELNPRNNAPGQPLDVQRRGKAKKLEGRNPE